MGSGTQKEITKDHARLWLLEKVKGSSPGDNSAQHAHLLRFRALRSLVTFCQQDHELVETLQNNIDSGIQNFK